MLKPAIQYKEPLIKLLTNLWFEDKYKYYNSEWYYSTPEIKNCTWDKHEFVSVDNDNNILGFIDYYVDRCANKATSFCALSFTATPTLAFGKDLYQAIDEVFCKFKFNKLRFAVIIGNPIEKTYDKLIAKYGGAVTGYSKQEVRLSDGELYDMKTYEIMREDYLKCKKNMNKQ